MEAIQRPLRLRWYACIGCWASSRSPVIIPRHLNAHKNEQPQADCNEADRQTAAVSGGTIVIAHRSVRWYVENADRALHFGRQGGERVLAGERDMLALVGLTVSCALDPRCHC